MYLKIMSVQTTKELMNRGMSFGYISTLPSLSTGLQRSLHKCNICGKELISRQSLTEHMILHTKESPHWCTICNKGFTRAPKLVEHMMLHTGERPYKCNLCGKGFIRRFRFTEHMATHSGKMPFQCVGCGKGYTAKYKLMDHAKKYAEKGLKCGYKQRPLQKNLGLNRSRSVPESMTLGMVRSEVDLTIDLTEGETSEVSNISREDFEQSSQEPEGMKNRDIRTESLTSDKVICIGLSELLKCSLCKAEFATKDDLNSHMSVHSQELLFKCTLCEKRFCSREELSEHMPIHALATSHGCDICEKSFNSINELRKHSTEAHPVADNQEISQRSISVEASSLDSSAKDFVTPVTDVYDECVVCGEGYIDKDDLRNHMMEHYERLGQNRAFLNVIDEDLDLSTNEHQYTTPGLNIASVTSINSEQHIAQNITQGVNITGEHSINSEPHIPQDTTQGIDIARLNSINSEQHISQDTTQDVNIASTNSMNSEEDILPSCDPVNEVIDLTDEVPDGLPDQDEHCSGPLDVPLISTVHVIEPCESTSSEDQLNQTASTSQVVYQQLSISDCSSSGMSVHDGETPTTPGESNPAENNPDCSMLTGERCNNSFTKDNLSDVIDLTDDPQCSGQEYNLAETPNESMIAGMFFGYQTQFARPDLEVTPEKHPAKCTICGKECISQRSLSEHMTVHTHNSPYRCMVCNKVFTRKQKLNQHMMLHTGERPFKCTVCMKGFIKKHRLKEHMTTHSGKLPFECTECGKGYTTNYKLTEHTRIHTGEKPYQCKICGAAFRLKTGLNEHVLTHSSEMSYHCGACNKGFTKLNALYDHEIARHLGKRPFKCPICSKGFVSNAALKKHMLVPC